MKTTFVRKSVHLFWIFAHRFLTNYFLKSLEDLKKSVLVLTKIFNLEDTLFNVYWITQYFRLVSFFRKLYMNRR